MSRQAACSSLGLADGHGSPAFFRCSLQQEAVTVAGRGADQNPSQGDIVTRKETPAHARPTKTGSEPAGPEPSYAERARTIVEMGRVGTLSSLSKRHPCWPFGSVMPYGLDDQGGPALLISTMAMHTQNLFQGLIPDAPGFFVAGCSKRR